LAEDGIKKGRYIVIDGKQRLFSILTFIKDAFALRGLIIRHDLNGCRFSDLKERNDELIDIIENQSIRTVIIRNWPDEDYLYSVFYRLNSGSLPLSSQELRKALHGGKLLDYIDRYTNTSTAFTNIFGDKPDRRMRDIELVLRYISFAQFYNQYSGNLKKFLDDAVKFYDRNWEKEHSTLDEHLERLNGALNAAFQVFGADAFKKWNGTTYEKRINRAIFDVITRYFSDPIIAELAVKYKDEIGECYKAICLKDEFKDAIERTTKTPKAVTTRHDTWGKALAAVLNKQFDSTDMKLL
jgi:arabinogalactan endo-1,4-beta-galactosidase